MPIGLCSGTEGTTCECPCAHDDGECSRPVDSTAREELEGRRSSVFTPPCRDVVELKAEGTSYQAANARTRELTGKGLMQQAYHSCDGIAQVDTYLREEGETARILEAHPEVCSRFFGDEALEYSKHSALGMEERLTRLDRPDEYSAGDWMEAARELQDSDVEDPGTVDLDDLLDACALAVTAVRDDLRRLPGSADGDGYPLLDDEEPPRDEEGFPMQMVFRDC